MIKNQNYSNWDYLLIFLLVANSGFPFFYRYVEWIIITLIISQIISYKKNIKFGNFFIGFVLFTTIILVGQMIFNGAIMSTLTFLGIYLRIYTSYLIFKILGQKFPILFMKIIYTFSIISFVFYIPSIIFPQFAHFFIDTIAPILRSPLYDETYRYNSPLSIIIYNFNGVFDYRNSGPFWEPGAFGGFLILAILFNLIQNSNVRNKENIVYSLAILSTLSTTAFIAFFILIILYQAFIKKRTNYLIIIPFLILGYILFNKLNFLEKKIDDKIENKTIVDIQSFRGRSRFASAILDLKDFIRSPIFGVSKSIEVRYKDENLNSINIHKNNGITTFLAQNGLVYFIFYFYFIFLGFRKYAITLYKNPKFSYLAVSLIFIIGFSESYFQYIFFIGLVFFHLNYRPYYKHSY